MAAHLNVSKDTIYRWIEKRAFPAHRADRWLRFKFSEVDAWARQDGDMEEETESEQ